MHLISPWGAHKSILFHQVVHPARNCRCVFREIVQFYDLMLCLVDKLGSYPRVFLAYLEMLVLVQTSKRFFKYWLMSTYQFYTFLRCFYIPCIGYVIEHLKPNTVHMSGQCNWSWEWFIKKGI